MLCYSTQPNFFICPKDKTSLAKNVVKNDGTVEEQICQWLFLCQTEGKASLAKVTSKTRSKTRPFLNIPKTWFEYIWQWWPSGLRCYSKFRWNTPEDAGSNRAQDLIVAIGIPKYFFWIL